MEIEITDTLLDIPVTQWNKVNHHGNPFTSHAFLTALEESNSIGGKTGWMPRYLLLWDNNGNLAGSLPMYEKHHSWGEYVFDWAWANAWQQCGLAYYPKLVVAVPFSPVTGHRFLVSMDQNRDDIISLMQSAAVDYAKKEEYSSLHYLFPTSSECDLLQQRGLLIRHDVQFQWKNRNYPDFKNFLATMTSRKRKKISRERRRVMEQDIDFKIISGDQLTGVSMERMYEFYLRTIMRHGSRAYLSREFFLLLTDRMADSIVLIEAHLQGRVVAAALNIRHDKTLYGRYWGCLEEYHSLHFETCYYQAISYCISHGLTRFEGGAQGEHKLSRGFLPVITCSAHWMANKRLTPAISDFLEREKAQVAHYQHILSEHSPFRDEPISS
jgi:predicted N-acyltransferase